MSSRIRSYLTGIARGKESPVGRRSSALTHFFKSTKVISPGWCFFTRGGCMGGVHPVVFLVFLQRDPPEPPAMSRVGVPLSAFRGKSLVQTVVWSLFTYPVKVFFALGVSFPPKGSSSDDMALEFSSWVPQRFYLPRPPAPSPRRPCALGGPWAVLPSGWGDTRGPPAGACVLPPVRPRLISPYGPFFFR